MKWLRKNDDFQMAMDLSLYAPDEIRVTTTRDKDVIVQAEHPERVEDDGYVARKFQCRIPIPMDVDPETVETAVTPDGMLIISVKRHAKPKEIIVPVIQMDHEPHRTEHPHLTPGCP